MIGLIKSSSSVSAEQIVNVQRLFKKKIHLWYLTVIQSYSLIYLKSVCDVPTVVSETAEKMSELVADILSSSKSCHIVAVFQI